jgi:hypothetical protein
MALSEAERDVRLTKQVPDTHLMAESFVIPPGMHAKKWITFYTNLKKPRIQNLTVIYTLDNGRTERARLAFRSLDSRWQYRM